MRAKHLFQTGFVAIGIVTGVAAQTVPAPPASAPLARDETLLDRKTQRVEHIHVEDAGSRVDEVRAGGETKSIKVQPKASMPAYDVLPADASGTGAASRETGPGAAGRRVWKVPF